MGLSEPLRCRKGRWRVPRCLCALGVVGSTDEGGFDGRASFHRVPPGHLAARTPPSGVGRKPPQTEDVDRRDGRHTRDRPSGGSRAPDGPASGPERTVHSRVLGSPEKRSVRPRLSPSSSYHLVFPGTAVPLPQAELPFKFQSCHCHWPPRPAVTLLSSSLG